MAIKKSELYSSLWESCDKLRGGMDASLYKDYILTLLFVKYVTDRYKGDRFAEIIVPEGGSFDDMVAAKNKSNIGEEIDKIISKLAEANNLKGVIDVAQFNDEEKIGKGQEMVDKLTELIGIFQNPKLDFKSNRAGGDDILGDAYEYLMQNFATESGKSKGQFYTPAEVSRVMAKVIGIANATSSSQTLYDPACGSGSLLIRAADEASVNITIYGQEKDVPTAGLAKMNLVLHNKATGTIARENTLAHPFFKEGDQNSNELKRFDYVVANPPFSLKAWGLGFNPSSDVYSRFTDYGLPPEKNGDYAWLLHLVKSMKSTGKGAIILPHGVLFRGNVEAAIRKNIIDHGYIKGIIGLPANLFYGTGIPACIIVLDKENASSRKGIFMIDASKGFIKDGNKNRLREQDIHKIVDVFTKQLEVPKYSRLVPNDEIKIDNDYNLNIPRYIDSSGPEDVQNIEAHLKGGIPAEDIEKLEMFWSVYPSLKTVLFSECERPGFLKLNVLKDDIRSTIFEHDEFVNYGKKVHSAANNWIDSNKEKLKNLKIGDNPKKLINDIGEQILEIFSEVSLIDNYDVYQQLLTYWGDIMQDDVYAICYDGWEAGREIDIEYTTPKKGKPKEKGFEGRIISKTLIISEYFKSEQTAIDDLEAKKDEVVRNYEELYEEYSGEEGLLSEVIVDEKIKPADLKARIKELKKEKSNDEELAVLQQYEKLLEEEAAYNKKIKEAKEALDKKVKDKYKILTVEEIEHLVVDLKWNKSIFEGIEAIYSAVSHNLASRIIELAERYETTLLEYNDEVEELEAKVKSHLERMGFAW
ncbi:type I restriction-modification system subunit M [Clostridium omnivorum]|uniref:site-specific DNA-methyltransferase (adenine-specific) n=1 Tax=Clostridium omnivorum TaxID=1604902 RepID=A0ABQ5N806_9CLOT|nr:type I restriction-modification system subunit M [Clostridium sp. E14]GLC31165.1 type I restriction-modification system subunit M [Clostridium sp. E14]